jgi:URI fold toxin 2
MGINSDPITLHKYLYANADPVNGIDPSGYMTLGGVMAGIAGGSILVGSAYFSGQNALAGSGTWDANGPSDKMLGLAYLLSVSSGQSLIKLTAMIHGNSKNSTKKQHVYEIWDNQRHDTFKYGISGGALNVNGTSKRANGQANALNNIVGWMRYTAQVLYKNIPGRIRALAIELALVNRYARTHGGKGPPGNLRPLPSI